MWSRSERQAAAAGLMPGVAGSRGRGGPGRAAGGGRHLVLASDADSNHV